MVLSEYNILDYVGSLKSFVIEHRSFLYEQYINSEEVRIVQIV